VPDRGFEPWWRPFRRAGGADVVHVDLTPHAAREAAALGWLDADERSRRDRFRHDGRRRQYTLCRAALRAILCGRLDCGNEALSFVESERGKPHVLLLGARAPGSFSVSHSGSHGLLAFAREGRIGVDVEERALRRDLDALIAAVLAPDERAVLASTTGHHRAARFYDFWTIKEALLKALGTGLQLDIAGFEVPPAMRRGVRAGAFRFPRLPGITWWVESLGTEDFAAALAHERAPASDGADEREAPSVEG